MINQKFLPCRRKTVAASLLILAFAHSLAAQDFSDLLAVQPRDYVAYRVLGPLEIDGRLDEPSWQRSPWSDPFVNIGGSESPAMVTRVKMLWDDAYFYIAADLEDPHVWASVTKRDSTIYHDNDFEVLIDPDGDTHEYYELAINSFGTVSDLFITKPYRDGGTVISSWDMVGLRTAVVVWGTVNNPQDLDQGWSVEIALPWTVLKEAARRPAPPRDGDQWRVNFHRVQWSVSSDEDRQGYAKVEGGREENWVWSPQGVPDMHYPEQWGYVLFSKISVGKTEVSYVENPERQALNLLREIYYNQLERYHSAGAFSSDLDSLGIRHRILRNFLWPPRVEVTQHTFEAWIEEVEDLHKDGYISRWAICEDSRVWKIQPTDMAE